ncbi:DUF3182 family protein [Achromobacter veterisilvae]|uniref:DUF3182 family protein n=1 Tax=Achromobacter veterisilvae TaxID=2069367 RepID=A0ABZ2RWP0_9BURK
MRLAERVAMTPTPTASAGIVAAYPRRATASEHEIASQDALALRLAALLGRRYVPGYRPSRHRGEPAPYYVPDRSIVGSARAAILGIKRAADLYGGVVPQAFVATKSISHGLVGPHAQSPPAWAQSLPDMLRDVVLTGYTAFSPEDALTAGERLLKRGPLRLKPADATAGRGQVVVGDPDALRAAVAAQSRQAMNQLGLVLEEDLEAVETYSVGWARVGKMEVAYVGTQTLTEDNGGNQVYGGSELRVARGGFDALRGLQLSERERLAVDMACRYDSAVSAAYPELLASRRNYDVAFGRGADGGPRAGVLEQSWRAGGASIAELAAMQAFALSPALKEVRAETKERYGADEPAPIVQRLVFHGMDAAVGPISKSGGILEQGNGRA